MRAARAVDREIVIGPISNLRRRQRGSRDPERFCRIYFPELFYNPFSKSQKLIIKSITDRIYYGGFQAVAAERGTGKTTIARIVGLIWAIVYGYIKYGVCINANGMFASGALEDVKQLYETNDLLAADFPEVCTPIRALEGKSQRAGGQSYQGQRTRLLWQKELIRFPAITGSMAAGALVCTKGIDGAIRGLVRDGKRPDLILADDCETAESARSAVETDKRMEVLNKDVIGLSGPGEPLSIAYLCTIIRRDSIGDILTDRKRSPAWHGIRSRMLITKPDREDLWATYIELRQKDQIDGFGYTPNANKFYLGKRKAMDAGAEVSDPFRFIGQAQADGMKLEISAIQHAHNLIADMGQENFDTEYQNDPPANDIETSGISVAAVCKKINYLPRGLVPTWCEKLTGFVDVGGRVLHWTVMAWKQGGTGYVVDYGADPVHSPTAGLLTSPDNIAEVRAAILAALIGWRDFVKGNPWPMADSDDVKDLDICYVDSGWQPDPVYKFCHQGLTFRPSKGFGSNQQAGKYRLARKGRRGAHWNRAKTATPGLWIWNLDADHYKLAAHNGILTPENLPGSVSLCGSEPVEHRAYAAQICAETYQTEFLPGKGERRNWKSTSRHNHFLDCLAGNIAAADIAGIGVLTDGTEEETHRQKISLSERQAARRRR